MIQATNGTIIDRLHDGLWSVNWSTDSDGLAAGLLELADPMTMLELCATHRDGSIAAGSYQVRLFDDWGIDQFLGEGEGLSRQTQTRITIRQGLFDPASPPAGTFPTRPHVLTPGVYALHIDFEAAVQTSGFLTVRFERGIARRRAWERER